MSWEPGEGPTCYCGNPTAVLMEDEDPILMCIAHSYSAGAVWELSDKEKPSNWPNLSTKELILFLWPGTPEAEIDAWLATRSPVEQADN